MNASFPGQETRAARVTIAAVTLIVAMTLVAYTSSAADRSSTIQGTWEGHYTCSQGVTAVQLTIFGEDQSQLSARFRFYALPMNPGVPSGEYELKGRFDPALGRLELSPFAWIDRPDSYSMAGLSGSLQPDQSHLDGTIDAQGCNRFSLYKVREDVRQLEGVKGVAPALLGALLISVPLAYVASLLLLSSYLRAVRRLMAQRGPAAMPETTLSAVAPAAAGATTGLQFQTFHAKEHGGSIAAAKALVRRSVIERWHTTAIYAIAGLACVAILAAAFIGASGTSISLPKFLVFGISLAWPVVLTIGLVVVVSRRGWLSIIAAYLVAWLLSVSAELSISERFSWVQAIVLWLILALPGTLIALSTLTRRIRAVGPMVLAFMLTAMAGLIVPYVLIGSDSVFRRIMWSGMAVGLKGQAPYYAVGLLGLLLFGLIGWLLLRWLDGLYRKRRISDQSIVVDAIWLSFSAFCGFLLTADGSLRWFLAAFAGFALYKLITIFGFALLSQGDKGSAPKLLLLRVFSLGKRSEQLFDAFGKLWRPAGSIRLIAGPDLATTTVEPHQFLDFASGQLARRFISGEETLRQRLADTGSQRDFDGRYRVSDFLCHEDTWKMALSRLAQESQAVLMDLRAFSATNNGCVFEINELLNRVPLSRTVFVIDDTTDFDFLRRTLDEGWARLAADSPNRGAMNPHVCLFRLPHLGGANVRRLVTAVACAAQE